MTTRRRALVRLAAIAGGLGLSPFFSGAASADLRMLTPGQISGPYYPKTKPRDRDWNLLSVDGGGPPDGVPLELTGVVTSTAGRPLPAMAMEIWQCDARGVYDHPRADNHADFDRRFQGYGTAETDENGAYRFLTIVPVPYPGRPPHIHVRIRRPDGTETLTTQLYIKDHPENERDGLLALMLFPGQDKLLIDLREAAVEGGLSGKAATFDFVVS